MADRGSGPMIARKRLGAELRRLRERENLRIQVAARELECSPARISRLENGHGPAKAVEVRALLALYGVTDDEIRRRVEEWTAATKSTSWWEPDSDLTSDDADRYLALETESSLLRMWCTPVLPVILQASDYARAQIRASHPERSAADVERLLRLHDRRQQRLLHRASGLRLDAIVDEAAVRRQVGSPEIHAAQLAWLADLLDTLEREERDDVIVRVLPFSAGSPGRALSAFAIFTPRESQDPVSAFVEETWGGAWYEGDEDTAPLVAIFTEVAEKALSPRDSRALLREP
jgi:transcriptional regulator with XRE-family HTH domain